MKLSADLAWRGLIKDKTFADTAWLDEPRVFYHGVDASADSLHIGNLAALMLARRLIDAGWKAILLVGGATTQVGDPGGKTEERLLLSREEITKNTGALKQQVSKLFDGKEFKLVDNYDWFKGVEYLDFLRDVGKHFSMSELMQREFVNARLGDQGSGISYAEFSYGLIQGYDYWQLFKNHRTELQIGGSDQWSNMLSGVALVRKKEATEAHALSIPLIVDKTTGRKFGKSESGAVWLDAQKTLPEQFYQFWINISDEDVENYLKVFTLLTKDEIEQLTADQNNDPSRRLAQKRLAEEVTKLVHGDEAAASATDHAKNITKTAAETVKLPAGISLIEALVKTGLATSNSEARRLIDSGGVYINNEPTKAEKLEAADFPDGRVLLRRGKAFKDSAFIELEG